MTPEKKEQFKTEKLEQCDEEIAKLENVILSVKERHSKEISELEEKLEKVSHETRNKT